METIKLTFDTLVEAADARPETAHRISAWLWLAECTVATFDGEALIVPSATWSDTFYRATPTHCSCPARGRCWHIEVVIIVRAALAEDAHYDALAAQDEYAAPVVIAKPKPVRSQAEKARINAEALELFA